MVSLLLFCHFKRKLYSQHNPIVPRSNGGEKKNAVADALPWEFLGYFCSLRFSVRFLHFSGWASLVTQPMLQHRQNGAELRSIDSYIQILCKFQKSKQKVPSLFTQKSPFTLLKDEKNLPLGDLLVMRGRGGTVEELFAYFFGIYIKFGYKNPSILSPLDSVGVAS